MKETGTHKEISKKIRCIIKNINSHNLSMDESVANWVAEKVCLILLRFL